ncbi:hypothetical protein QTP88_027614 [Uroleucon formosanum]
MCKNWRYSAKTKKYFPSKNKKCCGNIASLRKWRENKDVAKESSVKEPTSQTSTLHMSFATSTPVQENIVNITQTTSPILPKQCTSSINKYKLIKSISPTKEQNNFAVHGRRIININHFFGEIKKANDHSLFDCKFNDMVLIDEQMRGLDSVFHFKCSMCRKISKISTEGNSLDSGIMQINTAAVAAIMSNGCGFTHLQQFLSTLEIPCLSSNTYKKEHDKISEGYEIAATKEMELAAREEAQLAIKSGEVGADSILHISVVADGSWCKRSYRTQYNSLSGAAAIIGYRTKKVLYIGIRNKYCSTCVRSNEPSPHKCSRNWPVTSSSSGMEASIIVEGFKNSEEMYGLRYHKLIADGDSSVYQKILESRPYKNITVEKVECRNHLLRNLCNKLKDISTKRSAGKLEHRKLLSNNILRIRKGIVCAISYRKSNGHSVSDLRTDIMNTIHHVFGNHVACAEYFCDKKKLIGANYMEKIISQNYEFYEAMNKILRNLARHSSSLLQDVDNNIVESFNSIIAKFIEGKRVNYALKNAYHTRCMLATLSKNNKRPIYSLHKALYKKSNFKALEILRKEKQERQNQSRSKTKRFRKQLFKNSTDISYGSEASKPDMDVEEFSKQKEEILYEMKSLMKNREEIERQTVDQYQNIKWFETRRKLLTASNFGKIINRRLDTGCENIVKSFLYTTQFTVPQLEYGRENEPVALRELEKYLGKKIKPCGLFIDDKDFFLGATPDGLIDDDGIVEIKCPFSAAEITPEEGILTKKITFWQLQKNGTIGDYKKKHNYHFQVQGQLHVTKRKYCIFCVWTKKGLKSEKIMYDELFWQQNMLQKLTNFFFDCLLPEIIDPRHPGRPIRNPDYIIQAQKKKMPLPNVVHTL